MTSGEIFPLVMLATPPKCLTVLVMIAFNLWETVNHKPLREVNLDLSVWNMVKCGDISAFNIQQYDKRI